MYTSLFKLFICFLVWFIPFNLYAYVCPNNYVPHLLVNPNQTLDENYAPRKPTIPNVPFSFSETAEKQYMDFEAAHALELLFSAANSDDIYLKAVSGYRSYERQEIIYVSKYLQYGETLKGNAKPGQSEHQTGLAMDLSAESVGFELVQTFEYTAEGQWLANHAHEHGFIIRYPKHTQHITGYMYEPWHIRYVGKKLAFYLYDHQLTLDEIHCCCFH